MRTHQDLERRSLALHRLIANKIINTPSLFDKPRQTLERWRAVVPSSAHPYLQDWQTLVDSGMSSCLAVATQESEYADALRQNSPFCGVLTHKERFAFFKDWAKTHHETH